MNTPVEESYPIAKAVAKFIHDLEGIKRAEEIIGPLLRDVNQDTAQEFVKATRQFEGEPAGNRTVKYHVPLTSAKSFRAVVRKLALAVSAQNQTPRALFVAMVSAFDAYLGQLLRSVFMLKPEMIRASQRSLSFAELVEFDSIDAAREHIIADEVENFLRESHIEHFNWLESRLKLPLRKDLPSWAMFVEVTQRRNLYVHCDGVVSQQYINICRNNGVPLEGVEVGRGLTINSTYFDRAFSCLFEIGVKLAHVVWRKLAPHQLGPADDALNMVCFELLQNERYELAHNLLTFATSTLKKHKCALNRRMFVINLAIAAKFGMIGDVSQCLEAEDWSDCAMPFALAKAVLEDDYSTAVSHMKAIGPNDRLVSRYAYDTWPLFKEFRETDEFREAYKELFGESFVIEQRLCDAELPSVDECNLSNGEAKE